MFITELDHLALVSKNLKQGEDYVISKLGVKPTPGGRHPKQGTHNSLVKLGENRYLEIIAIDPDGDIPDRPRWFDLDNPDLQKNIAKQPMLLTWVARTNNMKQALLEASYNPGEPKSASRNSLEWTFTFTKDGTLIEGGLLPALIEWKTPQHPASTLPESHMDIKKIEAFHPFPEIIQGHLRSLGLQNILEVQNAGESKIGLRVTFNTPSGEVII